MAAALFPASLRRRNGSLAPAEQLLAGIASRDPFLGDEHALIWCVFVKGKTHVMLYFSSHVRLPCRAFTSRLAKWYSTNETKQSVEIVLISQDRQASDFKKDVDSVSCGTFNSPICVDGEILTHAHRMMCWLHVHTYRCRGWLCLTISTSCRKVLSLASKCIVFHV